MSVTEAPKYEPPKFNQQKAQQTALLCEAAFEVHGAKIKEFDAQLMTGTKASLELARQNAVGAFEAWLDAKYNHAFNILLSMDIDPTKRREK